ncbi:MAG: nitrogen fixation protein NifH [Anaerolineae bacterium]|jgi:hypothetical protein
MSSVWKQQLRADPIPWLLEPDNPSVRYFTLTDILDRAATDVDVQAAKADIMGSKLVGEIFAAQHPNGYWKKKGTGYFPQYKGTVWQLILLAELGVDGEDERVRRGCEQVLTSSLRNNGDFVAFHLLGLKIPLPVPNTCLPGNILRALLRFGYGNDRRVVRAIERLVERCQDTEWLCPPTKPNPCLWGVVKALSAFAELPADARPLAVQEAIRDGAELFLSFRFADEGNNQTITDPNWRRFGFPLYYQSDLLDALGVLVRLGYGPDERLQALLPLLLIKQDEQGRWPLEHDGNWRGQGMVTIGKVGQPSKWVTLNALRVLKQIREN